MKILVTGARGFIGKNLITELRNQGYSDIFEFAKDTNPALLDAYCLEAEFVFHLAGVNRPETQEEFIEGNFGFTLILLETLKMHKNECPVMISSSVQATQDNPYGYSKKKSEELIFEYGKQTGTDVLVYRFPNVFGKWCKPNYNSAVATFCYNIANGLPIKVRDPNTVINLVYIDDLVQELVMALNGKQTRAGDYCEVPIVYALKLGDIVSSIQSFKEYRQTLQVPNMADAFTKKLYSTYLSYLPQDQFSYTLKTKADQRGSFTEFIKTTERGQVSVNISKPGIIRGNHWHHTKIEKFLVVSGKGAIRLRKIGTNLINEYFVNGDKLEVIDIPPGFTHHIENMGDTDLITVMWANEQFDPEKPDTYFLEV